LVNKRSTQKDKAFRESVDIEFIVVSRIPSSFPISRKGKEKEPLAERDALVGAHNEDMRFDTSEVSR
jgi:hypothetical protein